MSQLAKNAERIANDVETANTVYRIKRPGRPTMLLVSDACMKSLRATVDFMARHPNWERELEEGRAELRDGRAVPLEELVAELDAKGRETPRITKTRRRGRTPTTSHRARTPR